MIFPLLQHFVANEKDHLWKADRNEVFAAQIDPEFTDWRGIVFFFTAIHLVEAVFARQGLHSRNHQERNQRLKKQHPDWYRLFQPLYQFSLSARYQMAPVNSDDVEDVLITSRFCRLEQLITRHLADQASA